MSYKKVPKYKPKKKPLLSLAPHNATLLNQYYCTHPKKHQYIRTIAGSVNCETTIEVCGLCGKHLTEPKTDC